MQLTYSIQIFVTDVTSVTAARGEGHNTLRTSQDATSATRKGEWCLTIFKEKMCVTETRGSPLPDILSVLAQGGELYL